MRHCVFRDTLNIITLLELNSQVLLCMLREGAAHEFEVII